VLSHKQHPTMEGRKFIFAVPAKRRQDHSSQPESFVDSSFIVSIEIFTAMRVQAIVATLRPSET